MEYPKWKYALVAFIMLFAALYAFPNIFPQEPAVQISPARGSVIDEALQGRIEGVLKGKSLAHKPVERTADRMLVRVADKQVQEQVAAALRAELGEKYFVALNMADTVPSWLEAIGAIPLTRGLDLQGGVHFLMEVDHRETRANLDRRYVNDIPTLLREKKIPYRGVNATPNGILVQLTSAEGRSQALAAIAEAQPDLVAEAVQGGPENFDVLATIRPEAIVGAERHTIEQNITTLRNRVNELGVKEPVIQQQGMNRIVVQLAGETDTAQAKKILGATATLEYRAVNESVDPRQVAESGRVPPDSKLYYTRQGEPVVLKKQVITTGDQLTGASATFDGETGTPAVSVRLDAAGGRRMLDFTSDNVGKPMAVVFIERIPETRIVNGKEERISRVSEQVISIANIRGVFGPQFQTTGLDSPAEASELALLLNAGSLVVPVDIVEERVIGPSLGEENIKRGMQAMGLSLVLIILFVMWYYRFIGVVTVLGLLSNLLLLVAVLGLFRATLTMPGIAGIVLTLGMAVDANVLIAERIREELRAGNSPLTSLAAGYEKAWGTILDANLTTLFAGLALFAFGSGPVKGFAVTLFVGILTSMFTAVVVTQAITSLVYSRQRKIKAISV